MRYFCLLFVTFSGCFLFLSCTKEEDRSSSIPYASVQITIQTQIENDFNIPLYSKVYSGQGYSGVIVISNIDASWLYAYDLCCPYDLNRVVMDSDKSIITVECPKCKSTYDLLNSGRVVSGPANERLKNYLVFKEGNFYKIRN